MIQRFIRLSASLLLIASCYSAFAQKEVPELWGTRVHDDAHVLKAETLDALEKQLAAYEDSTSNQIAILIIPSLDGDPIEDYSIRVVEKWKLGQKAKDNGVLILVAIDDHKMRIEVGQGLEGVLTDAICNRVIRNEMAPAFRRNDYDSGIEAAITAIIKAIGGEYNADGDEGGDDIWIAVAIIMVIFFIVILIVSFAKEFKSGSGKGGSSGRSSGGSWYSGSSGSSWSSGSSGSSWSGGGGSFGGGGSSGSW